MPATVSALKTRTSSRKLTGGDTTKILVTGAAGMLGSTLVPIFRAKSHQVYATDIDLRDDGISHLDVRVRSQVREIVRRLRPDLILHLAAKTDVELCEVETEDAYDTNAIGTENIVDACLEFEVPLVYISTAGVFDGTKADPYIETDRPNPLNVYAKTKLEGEKIVSSKLNQYFIVRAGWMMGSGLRKDKKFVAKILRQVLEGKREIHAVKDKIGTPTYTVDFSKNLLKLVSTRNYGLYHMVCHGRGTRFDVANQIASLLGNRITIIPVFSTHFDTEYFAPRPASEMLENRKLGLLGIDRMRDWSECLNEYFAKDLADELKTALPA